MANEKNNTNELVPEDDDTTAELEALTLGQNWSRPDAELESSADTCSFDKDSAKPEPSLAELQSELRSRDATINKLHYDVEHLRSQWLGLETEVAAREVQARRFNEDIEKLGAQQARKDKLLKARDDTIRELKAEIRERHAEQQALQLRCSQLESDRERAGSQADEFDRASLTERVAEQTRRIEALESENLSLRELLASEDVGEDRRLIAQQHGQLVDSGARTREFAARLEKAEGYADMLRRQLQDAEANAATAQASAEHLQESLQHALSRIESLQGELSVQGEAHAQLQRDFDDLQTSHAEEIRMIRFELGEAQETVSQQDLINEQLASDLIETRGYRAELETMLTQNEAANRQHIDKLELDNRKLSREVKDLTGKLETKSEAINCLLTELARKSQQIESIGDIEHAIDPMDERVAERLDTPTPVDKDRITRVLVGSVEGQELRFPLFKDRLTIGRTEQNDIQLKAAFISRRHAVIVTESDATRVVDWGSKNGVFVNGGRVTEHFLKNGDIVAIGTAKFRYEERPKRDA